MRYLKWTGRYKTFEILASTFDWLYYLWWRLFLLNKKVPAKSVDEWSLNLSSNLISAIKHNCGMSSMNWKGINFITQTHVGMDYAPFKKPSRLAGLFSYRSVIPPFPHKTLLCKLSWGPRPTGQGGEQASISSRKRKNPECESVRDFSLFTIHFSLFTDFVLPARDF